MPDSLVTSAPELPAVSAAWRVAAAGAVGVAAVAGLAVSGRTDPQAVLVAGGAVALAAAGFARGAARRAQASPTPSPAPAPDAPPFALAFEALPDPLMLVSAGEIDDQAGRRIDHANAAARELLRIPASGALMVAAVRRPEVLEALDEALFGRAQGRVAFEASGGADRFLTAWTLPLEPSAEAAADRCHAVLLLRDETEARRAERRRVDFLANASHELRTPLASLSGFIETLRGHARDDPAARDRFLGIMAAQAERMGRLTEDLLLLSRAELNEHVPPQGRYDLAQAAADVADALAPLAAERDVRLELSLTPPGAAMLAGERDQLVQVVQNLIVNALKYSPRGGRVVVEVAAGVPAEEPAPPAPDALGPATGGARAAILALERDPERRYVRLRVQDHGPGIRREHLSRLAERFYRVEGQKSGERNGTGLGLAIVKHIVNRHHGALLVESTPGLGSRFTVLAPALSDGEAAEGG